MDQKYLMFLRNLIVFTLVLGLAGYFAHYFIPGDFISPVLPYLFIFFFAVTLLIHYILRKLKQRKDSSFIRMFMLLTFGKLMFFLVVIVVYAILNKPDAIAFILNFFVLYLSYTIFEVNQSLKFVRSDKKAD